jgi:hypothetical protein
MTDKPKKSLHKPTQNENPGVVQALFTEMAKTKLWPIDLQPVSPARTNKGGEQMITPAMLKEGIKREKIN